MKDGYAGRPFETSEAQEEFDSTCENLKEKINSLLWRYLPEKATLKQAEDLAVDFFEKIKDVWVENKDR